MEQHFLKISKKEDKLDTQIFETFPGSFPSIPEPCSRNFKNFQLNGSHFGNSTAFGISGNVSGKFLYHLPLFVESPLFLGKT